MNLWKRLLTLIVLPIFLGLSGCQESSFSSGEAVSVQQVLSGQELELAGLSGQPEITEQVRLAGIAVPSLTQKPWGNAAKTQLEQMISHQSVVLESGGRTAQGQRSVYAWANGRLLNEQLVATGYALVTASKTLKSRYDLRLSRAQDRARILGLGIWNPQEPLRQPPGEPETRE